MGIMPFGATAQTTATPMGVQQQPSNGWQPRPVHMPGQPFNGGIAATPGYHGTPAPKWYGQLLKTAQPAFNQGLANGTLQGAPGYGNAQQQFQQLYGGFTGSTPVQSGLLGLAASGLANGTNVQGMTPQQLSGLANQYANQYATTGANTGFAKGFNNYLSGLGYNVLGDAPMGSNHPAIVHSPGHELVPRNGPAQPTTTPTQQPPLPPAAPQSYQFGNTSFTQPQLQQYFQGGWSPQQIALRAAETGATLDQIAAGMNAGVGNNNMTSSQVASYINDPANGLASKYTVSNGKVIGLSGFRD